MDANGKIQFILDLEKMRIELALQVIKTINLGPFSSKFKKEHIDKVSQKNKKCHEQAARIFNNPDVHDAMLKLDLNFDLWWSQCEALFRYLTKLGRELHKRSPDSVPENMYHFDEMKVLDLIKQERRN